MSQPFRLAPERTPESARIDRETTLAFTFNGESWRGHPGDTLASALLANGVAAVARSFKYHRPRGIFSAGSEEPNALVQLGVGAATVPNVPATRIELHEGLAASSANCWPSVDFDLGAIADVASPLLPAGFYYKTFMAPSGAWRLYEHLIRRAAGIGRAPIGPDPDTYDKTNRHCDVLVIGAGPAGLAAALAAGRTGARVILADEQPIAGGRLLDESREIDGMPGLRWAGTVGTELAAMPDVVRLPRTTAFGLYDHGFVGLLERRTDHDPHLPGPRQRLWRVRAKQIVLATGAIERPLAFPDNDRPGVMLAGAVRAYVNRYAVAPGRRAVVFANNDDAYRTALDLHAAGIDVTAVIDVRSGPDGEWPTRAVVAGIPVLDSSAVVGVHGRRRVDGVAIRSFDGMKLSGEVRQLECDLLAVSAGWNPAVHLYCHAGGKLRFEPVLAAYLPGETSAPVRVVGAAAGKFALADCLADGAAAGLAAAVDAGVRKKRVAVTARSADVEERPLAPVWEIPAPAGSRRKSFVDLADDVTAADLRIAAREGYVAAEHAKRYTTLGMGPDQGKTGNVPGLGVLAAASGAALPSLGVTTYRPPYTPITFGALAGRDVGALADPIRRTPIHHWHDRSGAAFEDVGQWKRPHYYPRAGETMAAAVARECLAARHAVGLLDASTLGKIEARGPDAAAFLDRIYCNDVADLRVGRCRYGLMLGEDGMVMDDGVIARLAENRFYLTTTTGNAARILGWLENWLQTEWPEMKVHLTSVTEHWAVASICGPVARALLAELAPTLELSPEAFPHMAVREATVADIAARVFRVSFTGEVGYEIAVPARFGLALWTALMTAGERHGLVPYGTEAMHVLRAEKGYVIVGQETDGTATPIDLGLARMVSRRKDFLGRRSLARADTVAAGRKELVGLRAADPRAVVPEGAHLVERPAEPPVAMLGHVTSSYVSANLGRGIALAMLRDGRQRIGDTVYVAQPDVSPGRWMPAEVTSPCFFDPDGGRLRD